MLGIALLGSGRMAQVYGPKIHAHSGLQLRSVFNPNLESARRTAETYGGKAVSDLNAMLADPSIDAVIIATPTDTHIDYIVAAAKAGKAIYCEKPIDQTLERVDQCLDVLQHYPVPFMLGFNRRFDPEVSALQQAVKSNQLGKLNFLMSTSREPSPPPIAYVKSSGGYFVDATIHDIDLMCWIADERPVEVFAQSSCMIDPDIGELGDADTSMTMLKMPSGCLVHINNCRRCTYGFDQRLEVFGDNGMIQTANQRDNNLIRWNKHGTQIQEPLKHFFLERYDVSFFHALDEFHDAVINGRDPTSTAKHGRDALAIALACKRSSEEGRAIQPDYND